MSNEAIAHTIEAHRKTADTHPGGISWQLVRLAETALAAEARANRNHEWGTEARREVQRLKDEKRWAEAKVERLTEGLKAIRAEIAKWSQPSMDGTRQRILAVIDEVLKS